MRRLDHVLKIHNATKRHQNKSSNIKKALLACNRVPCFCVCLCVCLPLSPSLCVVVSRYIHADPSLDQPKQQLRNLAGKRTLYGEGLAELSKTDLAHHCYTYLLNTCCDRLLKIKGDCIVCLQAMNTSIVQRQKNGIYKQTYQQMFFL